MQDSRERKRKILEKNMEQLWEDYEAAINQSATALDAPSQNKLMRQAEAIFKSIEKIEQELKSLESASPKIYPDVSKSDAERIYQEIRSNLPKIDFGLLEQILRTILEDYRQDGCAASLLFQESTRFGGEWCAKRIYQLLREKASEGRLRHIELEFQPSERADKLALPRRLGQMLGVELINENFQGLTQNVVEKLCGSLQNGSVLIIECRRCDYIFDDPAIARWVLQDFWGSIVTGLSSAAKNYDGIKVISLFFVDGNLSERCFEDDHRCTLEQFAKSKLLEIKLDPWAWEDISQWIVSYSGFSAYSREDIVFLAKKIFKATEGLPSLVANELLKECCPGPTG